MIVVEKPKSFWIATQAMLVEAEALVAVADVAWTEKLIRRDPQLKWVTGRYVEADSVNRNGHIFPADHLKADFESVTHKPMNLLHMPDRIVGHYVGAQLVMPRPGEGAAAVTQNPWVETLAALWAWYFPDAADKVEKAFKDGNLAQSMEAVPERLHCDTCDQEFAYDGRQSPSYCSCLQQPGAPKQLLNTTFSGGGLIYAPAKPAYPNAKITSLAAFIENHEDAQSVYDQVATEMPHLEPDVWESMMAQLILQAELEAVQEWAKSYTIVEREKLAKQGLAMMPDGSYPIVTVDDLRNAIRAIGRAPARKAKEVRMFIVKRAKALGAENLIPQGWM